jgi:hypothetical protein
VPDVTTTHRIPITIDPRISRPRHWWRCHGDRGRRWRTDSDSHPHRGE